MSEATFWLMESGQQRPAVEFDEAACTCDHPASAHDDGFGCTEPARYRETEPCPCLADWVIR
jgi:hypothetical protein